MNRNTEKLDGESGRNEPNPPRRSTRRMGRAYQAAFEAVIAVVVAGAAGGWADQRFGTEPFLLLAGVILGFGTFVLRLVRLMNELAPKSEGEDDEAKK